MTCFKSKVSKRVDVKDEWSHVTINRLNEPEDGMKGCAVPSSGLAMAFASLATQLRLSAPGSHSSGPVNSQSWKGCGLWGSTRHC